MSVQIKGEQGNYWFIVDIGVNPVSGRRRQAKRRGFRTKKAAQDALHELVAQRNAGTFIKPKRTTVAVFLVETWLPSIENRVRPTTADAYRRVVATHIVPRIGAASLQSLDEPTIEQWLTTLSDSRLSPKTIRNIHAVLSKALGDAMRWRLVARNAAARAPLPRVPQRKPLVWSAGQLRMFLEHVDGDRWVAMWRLLAMTGMRRGEVLGLRWQDVDLTSGTLTITQQRTIAGGSIVVGPPKTTSGARSVAIDALTTSLLKSWRSQQNGERLAMGAGWIDSGGLVFTWPDGSPPWPQAVTAWFKAHAEELGLPTIGVHGLRHTAATWLIASGESPKMVAQRLGHAHVSITLHLYSHVLPAHDRAAADAMAAAVQSATT